MKIAIDIDGILCFPIEYTRYDKATPIKNARKKVIKLINEGHEIFYYTARRGIDRVVTWEWLVKNGFPVRELIMDKPLADIYLDDNSISSFKDLGV